MNTAAITAPSSSGETTLQKEGKLSKELFSRLVNAFLNRMFDLKPEKAVRRTLYLIILFILSGFLVSLRTYPLNLWGQHLQDIFLYLFNPLYPPGYVGNPFAKFGIFIFRAFTDPRTLQYLPVLLASFFIALQCAAIYLADVFELDEVRVARHFIWEVALTGSDETIRITAGDISDAHRDSPNYLIGGPGKVIVDLDSVALFEKPDGTPHIIGPTVAGKATLEGFERFRQAIDIRDHYVDLRDQDDKSRSVSSRSLDGIPITATDVRLMFSVHRDDEKNPSKELPYSFNKSAIEKLIYRSSSRVTPHLPDASKYQFIWVNNMVSLIRRNLSVFMNEHNLTAYLASFGTPEFEKAKQREEDIVKQERQLNSPTEEPLETKDLKPPPDFKPRDEITNLFTKFTEEFTNNARDRGVELHWIGVGTWETPIELVSEKHLEAWKLSRENLIKGRKEIIEQFEKDAISLKMTTLIQDVPIAAHQAALQKEQEYENAMRLVLIAYEQQLINARDFIKAKGEAVPQIIEDAISYIRSAFGRWIS